MTPMTSVSSSFTNSPDHDALCLSMTDEEKDKFDAREREFFSRSLRDHRRYRGQFNPPLPPVLLNDDYDGYKVVTDYGEIYLYPIYPTAKAGVIKTIGGTIPGRLLRPRWRASVEVMVGGGRWHPPEADEVYICDSESLYGCVHAALAICELEAVENRVRDDGLAEHYARGTDAETQAAELMVE